jgi:hypothetical protein
MSLSEIEAELRHLTAAELRELALKSWKAFAEKDEQSGVAHECSEDDPALLAALDEAIAHASTRPGEGLSADEVRTQMGRWISK